MLSVVIPALNEAAGIGRAIASAWAAGAGEVIVVDGGSIDDTARVAQAAGARVLVAGRGRAVQMNAGVAAATGAVLLFLHADTLLPAGAGAAVAHALAAPDVSGGCFRLRFDQPGALYGLYSWVTYRNLPWLVFGDRALFVRRTVFEKLGGFGPMPVFEDVDLVRRLGQAGRFCFLDAAVVTSARRFEAEGALRRQLRNAVLYVRYRLGTAPERLAAGYRYPTPDAGVIAARGRRGSASE